MRASVMRATLGAVLLLLLGLPAEAQSPSDLLLSVGHAPEPADVGSDLSFEIDVSNPGPGEATAVSLVVRFPDADAVLASAQTGQGLCAETAPGEVTCDVGTLAEGAQVSAQVVVTPVTASTLSATAEANSAEDSPAAGSDAATVNGRPCDVVGTQGDDTVGADSPGQVVCGLGGNDLLTGLDGDETLYGGTGDDMLAGRAGNDVLDGGDGVDTATYAAAPEGVRADLEAGTVAVGTETEVLVGMENISGSPYDDWIEGSSGPNLISGGDGLDLLWGGEGDDVLLGESGDDYLNGGPGADELDGGSGVNTCARGTGTAVRCHLDSPLDANDAKGRMDVQRIRTTFGETASTWRFRTQRPWSLKDIWDQGFSLIRLDTSGGPSAEYQILVRVGRDGRRLTAFLTRLSSGKRWGLDAWRPGSRSLAVRLPMSRVSFGSGRTYFRWWGQTLFSHRWCKRAVCFDLTPGPTSSVTLIQPVL